METHEILFEVYCDETTPLMDVIKLHEDVDIEFASGFGGLEIIGTLIIPGAALALQVLSLIREMKRKEYPTLIIKQVHIHIDNNRTLISAPTLEELEKVLINIEK